jgi:hypothetical protein
MQHHGLRKWGTSQLSDRSYLRATWLTAAAAGWQELQLGLMCGSVLLLLLLLYRATLLPVVCWSYVGILPADFCIAAAVAL